MKLSYIVLLAVSLAFCLIGWELAVSGNRSLAFLVGQPSQILADAGHDVAHAALLTDVGKTLANAVLGLMLGSAVGYMAGMLVIYSRGADAALSPLINVMSVVPLFAVGPMTVFWFGQGMASKVFIASLAAGFLAVTLTYQYACSTPVAAKELVLMMARRRWPVFLHVEAPYAFLRLLTNIRVLMGAAVSGSIVGEFIGSSHGVGHYILVAEGLYDVNRIWAGVLALSVGAMFLGWLGARIEAYARSRL